MSLIIFAATEKPIKGYKKAIKELITLLEEARKVALDEGDTERARIYEMRIEEYEGDITSKALKYFRSDFFTDAQVNNYTLAIMSEMEELQRENSTH